MDPEPNFIDKQCPGNVKVKSRIFFLSQYNFFKFFSKMAQFFDGKAHITGTLENL